MSLAESAETALRMPLAPRGHVLVTMLQLVPSQCSTRAPEKPPHPTAQTLFAEMAVTTAWRAAPSRAPGS